MRDVVSTRRLSLLAMAETAEKLKDCIHTYIMTHSQAVIPMLNNTEDTIRRALEDNQGGRPVLTER